MKYKVSVAELSSIKFYPYLGYIRNSFFRWIYWSVLKKLFKLKSPKSKWAELQLSFSDAFDPENVTPICGKIRAERKLIEKIQKAFINNQLKLNILGTCELDYQEEHPIKTKVPVHFAEFVNLRKTA